MYFVSAIHSARKMSVHSVIQHRKNFDLEHQILATDSQASSRKGNRFPTWVRYLNATAASFVLTACYGMPGDYMYSGMYDTGYNKPDFSVGDTGNPSIRDMDNDGASFTEDCDDNNPDVGSIEDDADCDQIISALDCDDNDPSNTNIPMKEIWIVIAFRQRQTVMTTMPKTQRQTRRRSRLRWRSK